MHGAATNRHARHAIGFKPFSSDRHTVHVTVTNYGNLGLGRDLANPFPIGKAVVPLQAGTAMHREHLYTFALGNFQSFHHVNALVIPTDSAFKRQGNIYARSIQGGFNIVQNLLQAGQIAQKTRPAPLPRHLGSRAARIHLDKLRVKVFGYFFSGSGHLVRESSKDLDPKRAFFGEKLKLLVAIQAKDRITVSRNEFRHQKSHTIAGKNPAKSTEGGIRHPVHRAKDSVRKYIQISEFETFQHFNHNYSQIVRNKNPKKLFNLS